MEVFQLVGSMDTQSFKTYSAKPAEVAGTWYVIDAENQVVGRLATKAATLLRGKHKPEFTPHVDMGDYVVIINADKVRFTGNKEAKKEYFSHSGYPGGSKVTTPRLVREKKPAFIVEHAVKGMLPKNRLGRQLLKKLKVYAGAEHPHEAQQPVAIEL